VRSFFRFGVPELEKDYKDECKEMEKLPLGNNCDEEKILVD